MKIYKLKEEVKKFIDIECHDGQEKLTTWENMGLTLEALEEVVKDVDLRLDGIGSDLSKGLCLTKHDGEWTQQERADIEAFLNKRQKVIDVELEPNDSGVYTIPCKDGETYRITIKD